jgi:hypothetical protein
MRKVDLIKWQMSNCYFRLLRSKNNAILISSRLIFGNLQILFHVFSPWFMCWTNLCPLIYCPGCIWRKDRLYDLRLFWSNTHSENSTLLGMSLLFLIADVGSSHVLCGTFSPAPNTQVLWGLYPSIKDNHVLWPRFCMGLRGQIGQEVK